MSMKRERAAAATAGTFLRAAVQGASDDQIAAATGLSAAAVRRRRVIPGDAIRVMRRLVEADSIDAVVVDPPYGQGVDRDRRAQDEPRRSAASLGDDAFWGVSPGTEEGAGWDHYKTEAEFWRFTREWAREAYHVLKPGGLLLSFMAYGRYTELRRALWFAGFDVGPGLAWRRRATMRKGKGHERRVREVDKRLGVFSTIGGYVEHDAYPVPGQGQGERATAERAEFEPRSAGAQDFKRFLQSLGIPVPFAAEDSEGMEMTPVDVDDDGRLREYERFLAEAPGTEAPALPNADRELELIVVARKPEALDAASPLLCRRYPSGRAPKLQLHGEPPRCRVLEYEREPQEPGAHHPTRKPVDLMLELVTLATPPGGVVLDFFAGEGATLLAARRAGVGYLGIERRPHYVDTCRSRLDQEAHPRELDEVGR
jgi:DNA modification methylase